MPIPPLQPLTVSSILAFLNPLDDIPPALLSTPLRQRHHFLSISPFGGDPAAYLAWPPASLQEKQILDELLAAVPSAEDIDPLQTYSTVYTNDGEATFAHARVPVHDFSSSGKGGEGLRLIFLWEGRPDDEDAFLEQSNWKYHDVKPMPFPKGASTSPESSSSSSPVSPISSDTFSSDDSSSSQHNHAPAGMMFSGHTLHSVSDPITGAHPPPLTSEFESDDDDYWNSYGQDDKDGSGAKGKYKDMDEEKAEDAYWAQYASVQGTADSTIPSPTIPKSNLKGLQDTSQALLNSFNTANDHHHSSQNSFSEGPTEFDPELATRTDYMARIFSLQRDAEFGPAGGAASVHDLSPHALELRLHNISPRPPPQLNSVSPSPAPLLSLPDSNSRVAAADENAEDDEYDHVQLSGGASGKGESEKNTSVTVSPPSSASPLDINIVSPRPRRSNERISVLEGEDRMDSGLSLAGRGSTSLSQSEAPTDPSEAAVREALKGVYRLWSTSKSHLYRDTSAQKDAFTDIVKDVLTAL